MRNDWKIIGELTDKSVLGTGGLSNKEPRKTSRAIMVNGEGKYAVMYAEKFHLYSLPGGGIDDGEDEVSALVREMFEETGCSCDFIEPIGIVYENRFHADFTSLSHYFFVKTNTKESLLHLTDEEIENGTLLKWCSLDEAIHLIGDIEHETAQRKFLQARDLLALHEYKRKKFPVHSSSGILIIGLNGSGKSTVCRELARRLDYKRMDVEDYYFLDSEIPYTVSRTREEVQQMIIDDIAEFQNYVLCSVNCNWDSEILDSLRLAVLLYAPLEVRMERIKQREEKRFGKRVLEGGDMYESQQEFHAFVATRSHEDVKKQANALKCPVLEIDATLPIDMIVEKVYDYYKKGGLV